MYVCVCVCVCVCIYIHIYIYIYIYICPYILSSSMYTTLMPIPPINTHPNMPRMQRDSLSLARALSLPPYLPPSLPPSFSRPLSPESI